MDKKNGRQRADQSNKQANHNLDINAVKAALRAISAPARRRALFALHRINHPLSTAEIASYCAIGNVSDCMIRLREDLASFGLGIEKIEPKPSLKNRFGDPSPMAKWRLVSLNQEAA